MASAAAHRTAALLGTLQLSGCVAGVRDIHDSTRALSEASTNFELAVNGFPRASCAKLALPREVEAWLGPDEPPRAPAFRRPSNQAMTIVNTDVDDTLIASLWDRGRYAFGARYPGVMELLAAQGQALQVLTARPAFLRQGVRDELCGWLRESGAAACEVGVSTGELGSVLDSLDMGLVKAQALLRQRRELPRATTVFNGDSGQGDWIAALVVRDLDPEGVPYAAIHDVRAWSLDHRVELGSELLTSERLADIYRGALPMAAGEPPSAHAARVEGRLRRIRSRVRRALDGPGGRLDGVFLRAHGIFLHRSYAMLALDLAGAGLIAQRDADHVLRRAVRHLCHASELGFDDGERERLVSRLSARAAGR